MHQTIALLGLMLCGCEALWGPFSSPVVAGQGPDGGAESSPDLLLSVPPGPPLYGVAAHTESDVHVVGARGLIAHWDGAAWSSEPSGVTTPLRAVREVGNQETWAVGDQGVALTRKGPPGSPWLRRDLGSSKDLLAVAGDSVRVAIAVGAQSTIFNGPFGGSVLYDNSARMFFGTLSATETVGQGASLTYWVSGSPGYIAARRENATTWVAEDLSSVGAVTATLRAMWTNEKLLWVVGDKGLILSRRADTASPWFRYDLSACQCDLFSVGAADIASLDAIWVTGNNGSIYQLKFDSSSGRPAMIQDQRPPGACGTPANSFFAVSSLSTGQDWFVGSDGMACEHVGNRWYDRSLPPGF